MIPTPNSSRPNRSWWDALPEMQSIEPADHKTGTHFRLLRIQLDIPDEPLVTAAKDTFQELHQACLAAFSALWFLIRRRFRR